MQINFKKQYSKISLWLTLHPLHTCQQLQTALFSILNTRSQITFNLVRLSRTITSTRFHAPRLTRLERIHFAGLETTTVKFALLLIIKSLLLSVSQLLEKVCDFFLVFLEIGQLVFVVDGELL